MKYLKISLCPAASVRVL